MHQQSSDEREPAGKEINRPFKRVAVLGAGTMGSQIAAHFANAGLHVDLLDIAPKEGANKNAIVEKLFKQAGKLKPAPFFTAAASKRIRLGNMDEHLGRLSEVDWVVEVVVERMDIKRSVLKKVEAHIGPDTIVSSNTSGLPIADISSECSDSFNTRFLGTHFFNPPRYLKLLEVIPTPATNPDVVERVKHFARIHLGKGIVIAKDRPYFIGNRIGIYGMKCAIDKFTNGEYSIEEVDKLTGPVMGRPKSGTFRTADVVGLDVMRHVVENLRQALPDDESIEKFNTPKVLDDLIDAGALGAKTRAGFYKKEGKVIKSIDPASGSYQEPKPLDLPGFDEIKKISDLGKRLVALYEDEGRVGSFFRETTLDMMAYAARRIPEVTDHINSVDNAICWGFGWELGPFQIWDVIGFERVLAEMRNMDFALPDWINQMDTDGIESFYKGTSGDLQVYQPGSGSFELLQAPGDELTLPALLLDKDRVLWKNSESTLVDAGDGVAIFEFHSKANSLGQEVMQGLNAAIDFVEAGRNLRGVVVGNTGSNFSVGANLGELAMAVAMGDFDMVKEVVRQFQQTIQRVRYAEKPVVVAGHQMMLGGACEMLMACPHPVVASESYIGLVELGVGVIPAGTGTMRLAALASAEAPNGFDSEIQASLIKYFQQVAMAKVATSAREAQEMGYLSPSGLICMNSDRRFQVAKTEVIRLSKQGYLAPPVNSSIRVLGKAGAAAMEVAAYQFLQGRFISEYDQFLASRLAFVMCGGDLTGPEYVHEDYLLELEREVFVELLSEDKTKERITHILSTNKPLRN